MWAMIASSIGLIIWTVPLSYKAYKYNKDKIIDAQVFENSVKSSGKVDEK